MMGDFLKSALFGGLHSKMTQSLTLSLDGNNYGNCQKPGISKTKDGVTTAVLSNWNKIAVYKQYKFSLEVKGHIQLWTQQESTVLLLR